MDWLDDLDRFHTTYEFRKTYKENTLTAYLSEI